MNKIRSLVHFIYSQRVFLIAIAFGLLLFLWLDSRVIKPKYDALNNPILEQIQKEQGDRIENLESIVLALSKEISEKSVKDSILQVTSKKEISELKLFIANKKTENEKKHIFNNSTTTDESALILRNNIKKRTVKN